MNKTIPLITLILTGALNLFSQDVKKEVERNINRSEMPKTAMKLLEPLLENAEKAFYFYETDGDRESYEAELLWNGRELSIEFSLNGNLQDIEEVMSLKDFKENVRRAIDKFYDKNFSKSRHLRIQIQYTSDEESDDETMEEFIEGEKDDLIIRYEIVSEVKEGNDIKIYELLFDDEGRVLNRREVVRRSGDNLRY